MSFVDFSACISLYFSWHKVNDIRILFHTRFCFDGSFVEQLTTWTRRMPLEVFSQFLFYSKSYQLIQFALYAWKFLLLYGIWRLKLKKKKGIDHCISLFLARGWAGAGKTLQVIICLVKGLLGERQIWPLTVSYTSPLTEKVDQCEKPGAERILLFMKPLFVCRCCRLGVAVMVTKVFYGHF